LSEELILDDSPSSKPQDTTIDDVVISLDVVLGETEMALHELLRLGRGAVIALDATEEDDVRILAGETQIASGQLRLNGEQIEVTVTENQLRGQVYREPSDKFIKPAEASQ